jgi:hypothetical protein
VQEREHRVARDDGRGGDRGKSATPRELAPIRERFKRALSAGEAHAWLEPGAQFGKVVLIV